MLKRRPAFAPRSSGKQSALYNSSIPIASLRDSSRPGALDSCKDEISARRTNHLRLSTKLWPNNFGVGRTSLEKRLVLGGALVHRKQSWVWCGIIRIDSASA